MRLSTWAAKSNEARRQHRLPGNSQALFGLVPPTDHLACSSTKILLGLVLKCTEQPLVWLLLTDPLVCYVATSFFWGSLPSRISTLWAHAF